MKRIIKISGLVVLVYCSAFFMGCLDKISFPSLNDEQTAIVVEGSLRIGNPSVARISITRLFDFSADGLKAVNLQEATLMDEEGRERALKEISPGVYETRVFSSDTDFKVELGKSYQMRIATFDGRAFLSKPEPVVKVDPVGDLYVDQTVKEVVDQFGEFSTLDLLSFSVDAPVQVGQSGEAGRFRYVVEQTYKLTDSPVVGFPPPDPKTCYVTELTDVTSALVFNANEFTGTANVRIPVVDILRKNTLFSEGYYLTIYQQSLSENAYKYWNEISQVIERNGNMFEAPAGRIRSNFQPIDENSDDEVFGYFYATQEDTARIYVDPSLADFPAAYCPGPPSPQPFGARCLPRFPCCDCLLQNGSSLEKPSFWVD